MKHEKFVLLMHATGCERAEEFAPTLSRVAVAVPGAITIEIALLTAADIFQKKVGWGVSFHNEESSNAFPNKFSGP